MSFLLSATSFASNASMLFMRASSTVGFGRDMSTGGASGSSRTCLLPRTLDTPRQIAPKNRAGSGTASSRLSSESQLRSGFSSGRFTN